MKMPDSLEEAESRLEINNLLNIYCACRNQDKKTSIASYASKEISVFKKDLADSII